jgi:hypothetical protein
MLGSVVFGSRTWMCDRGAGLGVSIAEGDLLGVTAPPIFLGESADPVTAQEIITLRCTAASRLPFLNSLHRSAGAGYWIAASVALPPFVRCAKPRRTRSGLESAAEITGDFRAKRVFQAYRREGRR